MNADEKIQKHLDNIIKCLEVKIDHVKGEINIMMQDISDPIMRNLFLSGYHNKIKFYTALIKQCEVNKYFFLEDEKDGSIKR